MSPVLLIAIYLCISALTAWMTDLCLRRWKRTAHIAKKLRVCWVTLQVLLALLPVTGAFLPDSPAKFALQAAGNIYLGFYLYYGLVLLVLLGLMLLARLFSRGRVGRDWHGGVICVTMAVALLLGGYGMVHARNTVVDRRELTVDKPGGDMKIVLIGDLHLSVNSRLSTTQRMVELINAEQPDAVLVAGDVFTSSYGALAHPERYAEALRGIRAKYGVYAVYGNHDVEETLFGGFPISPVSQAFRTREMERFFDDCGFIALTDAVVTLDNGVQLAGRIDGERAGDGTANRMAARQLLAGVDDGLPVLVLQHEPKEFQALKEAGADIAMCGHTHAGQLFPGTLVIRLFSENAWGYVRVHGLDTFVTAGVGTYGPPMRVGTDSEITVIELHFSGEREAEP